MNSSNGVFKILGIVFLGIGIFQVVLFSTIEIITQQPTILVGAIPALTFVIVGSCFLSISSKRSKRQLMVRENGQRFAAVIVGYQQNRRVTVNHRYPDDLKVRYYTSIGDIREAVIPVGTLDSGKYPVGYSLDIYELNGEYSWDELSIHMDPSPNCQALLNYGSYAASSVGAQVGAQTPGGQFMQGMQNFQQRQDLQNMTPSYPQGGKYVSVCMGCGEKLYSNSGFITRCPTCGSAARIE